MTLAAKPWRVSERCPGHPDLCWFPVPGLPVPGGGGSLALFHPSCLLNVLTLVPQRLLACDIQAGLRVVSPCCSFLNLLPGRFSPAPRAPVTSPRLRRGHKHRWEGPLSVLTEKRWDEQIATTV